MILLLGRQSEGDHVACSQRSDIQFDTRSDERTIVFARWSSRGKYYEPVLQVRYVGQSRMVLIIGPEVFAVGVEDDSAHWDLLPASLGDGGVGAIELREEQLVQV